MAFRTAALCATVALCASATYPPESQRPTLEQRDICIAKSKQKGCISLDKNRSSEAYKACAVVSDKVSDMMQENPTKACHDMGTDFDHGDYEKDHLKDDYYKCVAECGKVAKKNAFFFKNVFKPLFITCGIKAEDSPLFIAKNFPTADKRPTWEQRDICISKTPWTMCYSLDHDRASDAYKACLKVEDKVEDKMQENPINACHEMETDADSSDYENDKLADSYYECVERTLKIAKKNEFYLEKEFKPLFIHCGTLQPTVSDIMV